MNTTEYTLTPHKNGSKTGSSPFYPVIPFWIFNELINLISSFGEELCKLLENV